MEDIQKKLSRPIKDLDDIRFAMAALKDIRENEIRIDMSIGPIEVSGSQVCGTISKYKSSYFFMVNIWDLWRRFWLAFRCQQLKLVITVKV